MPDFLNKFADNTDSQTGELKFSNWRSGLIVALVSRTTEFYQTTDEC
jgi:SP family sugar:H+ symporter-like MFS transporter